MRTIAALLATALLAGSAPARAAVIARLPQDVPVSAGRGWVVWSTPAGGGYGLTAWRGGVVAPLPVRPRDTPFDLDVGTDTDGGDVVTFTRRGRIRALDLVSGRERAPAVPHPAGTTDSWPSMWHGRVAFAHRDPRRHPRVVQVALWRPGHAVRLLHHGSAPRDPTGLFTGVDGTDLRGHRVAFLWRVAGQGIIGSGGGREIRVDDVRDGSTRLAGVGYAGEVCTGAPDGSLLSTPALDGRGVWFLETTTDCYAQTSRIKRFDTATHRGRSGAIAGTLLRFAADAGAVYVLSGTQAGNEPAACPCALERLDPPALTHREQRPRPPFY